MLFQERLLNKVDNYISTKTLPRTIMLEGQQGCGKHTLAKYIADKLEVEFLDITDNLNLETMENITLSVTPRVYFINSKDISVKEQNVILKFLEEPLKNSYIILSSENRNLLLNTVVNRCIILEFEIYTTEQLKQFLVEGSNEYILQFANTPGRVIEFTNHNISGMVELATKMLTQIQIANYSNVLKIPNNINFSNNSELFDFDIFVYILINVAFDLYKQQKINYDVFNVTSQFYNDCSIPRIGKQHLFEHYLISLKRVFEEE